MDLVMETDVKIGDVVRINISKDDPYKESVLSIIGVDKTYIFDVEKDKEAETILDDYKEPKEEIIEVG